MANIVGQYSATNNYNETLVGTNGNDTIDHKGGSDTIDGGAGVDTVVFNDSKNNFSITTVAGITHVVGSGIATADYRNTDAIITSVEGLQFTDGLVPLAGITPSGLILGSRYSFSLTKDEIWTGTNGDNTIDPQGGSDTINGNGGNDTVAFFDSKDNFFINSIAGITHVIGSSIAASQYRNTDSILTNIKTLQFTDGAVALPAITPSGVILDGRYSINSPKNSYIKGTNGDNTIDPYGGSDIIDGSAGNDTVTIFDYKNNFDVATLAGITHLVGLTTANSDYKGNLSTLTNVETIQFLDGSKTLPNTVAVGLMLGNTASETITGTNGDNTIEPHGGSDTIDGGAGVDNVLFFDNKSNFAITTVSGVMHVKGLSTAAGSYRNTDTQLSNVEKITFLDTAIMFNTNSTAGQAYRIYKAAFDRTPDAGGLGFWINALEKGASLQSAAAGFIQSAEFTALYGANPTPESFVAKVYTNVLHRAYDQAGFDYWLGTIKNGANSQATVLAQFSESPENQAAVLTLIGNGVEYTPFIG
jgi:Ca2+-binding RTX toxin-like protein